MQSLVYLIYFFFKLFGWNKYKDSIINTNEYPYCMIKGIRVFVRAIYYLKLLATAEINQYIKR